MSRRFWIAVGAGAVLGGGAVLGFGPYVRAQVETKAARYGAQVDIQHVVPSWTGVRLRGVEVTIESMPGVRIWLDDVVVGWSERRPLSMAGGKILAIGRIDELVAHFERWRAERFKGSGQGGASRPLTVEGFDLDWRDADEHPSSSLHASGLRATREAGAVSFSAEHVSAQTGGIELAVDGGRLVLARSNGSYRVAELASEVLSIEYRFGASGLPAPTNKGGEDEEGEADTAPHPRVRRARQAHAWLLALGRRLDQVVEADAEVAVRGARARLLFDGETLNLGPAPWASPARRAIWWSPWSLSYAAKATP